MQIVRFSEANAYVAPKHFDVHCLRLQGEEASNAETCSVGFSQFLPGGGAEMGATPFEKIYVVLSGEITIVVDGETATLRALDSCTIKAGESRSVMNNTNEVATMLVILQYAKS